MVARVGLITGSFPRSLGFMDTGREHPFTNYNENGERELLVFRCNESGTQTEVFKAKEWEREINPNDLNNADKFTLEQTLNPGDDYIINVTKDKYAKDLKIVHIVQDNKPIPEAIRKLKLTPTNFD